MEEENLISENGSSCTEQAVCTAEVRSEFNNAPRGGAGRHDYANSNGCDGGRRSEYGG